MAGSMFYVYILRSISCDKYYIGYTSDLDKRLENHNSGLQRWTRNKGPWIMVYSKKFSNKRDAIIKENELKSKKSRIIIERIIKENNKHRGG